MKPIDVTRASATAAPDPDALAAAMALAEGVLDRVARSPDPGHVLVLVSSDATRRSYQRLAQRLHPDRFPNVSDEERARLEEAFKLAKAAWEASTENPQRSASAAAHFAAEHVRLRSLRPAPRAERPDAFGGPAPTADAEAAAAAFRRAQAEAAAAAATTNERRRSFARKELEDYGSGLTAELRELSRLAQASLDPGLAELASELTRRAASIPTAMVPPLDPRCRGARRRLDHYETQTRGELLSLSTSLTYLKNELEVARSTHAARSQRLAQARLCLNQASLALHNLRKAEGPAAELGRWEQRLGESGARLKTLATTLRVESEALAELARSVNRLTSTLSMKESQVARDPTVRHGREALRSALDLSRASFGRWTKEWGARVGMASEAIAVMLGELESRVRVSIAAARRQGLEDVSIALVRVSETELVRARNLRDCISTDVVNALQPALQGRLEGFLSDLDRLCCARVEREGPKGGVERRAARVSGLSNGELESAWNQALDWADQLWIARDAERERLASERQARASALETRRAAARR